MNYRLRINRIPKKSKPVFSGFREQFHEIVSRQVMGLVHIEKKSWPGDAGISDRFMAASLNRPTLMLASKADVVLPNLPLLSLIKKISFAKPFAYLFL
jgi:hypothetical protein